MADSSSTFIKIGLFGAAGYIAYTQGWLSFLGLSPTGATGATATPSAPAAPAPSAPAATPPAATPPPAAPAPNAFKTDNLNSLDAVYTALQSKAGSGPYTADEWNWYLMQAVPQFTTPDPVPLFSGLQNWTRDLKMPLGSYWLVMSQYLAQSQGLSGMGRYAGVYRGLAAIARQQRRTY